MSDYRRRFFAAGLRGAPFVDAAFRPDDFFFVFFAAFGLARGAADGFFRPPALPPPKIDSQPSAYEPVLPTRITDMRACLLC